jgi:hypothetical protein
VIKYRFIKGARIALFVIVSITVLSWIVMSLWNALLPTLFGWRTIGFVQAAGLLILSRILFGGVRGPGFRSPWRHHMDARWAQMSPEQREKFREGLRHRCRGTTPPEESANS